MTDMSHLDVKYFIDDKIYNCPFCNRRHVSYAIRWHQEFDWSNQKKCHIWVVACSSCQKVSMHLTYDNIGRPLDGGGKRAWNKFESGIDIDSHIFYSVPTSFFTVDSRIPRVVRELITEAEGCVKMNFLTGASACTRKAIYELLYKENATGDDYKDKVKSLKSKYSNIDSELFDVLGHIQGMTSDKVHEQSWEKWDSKHLHLFIETLKAILNEIYVLPDERKKTKEKIGELYENVNKNK